MRSFLGSSCSSLLFFINSVPCFMQFKIRPGNSGLFNSVQIFSHCVVLIFAFGSFFFSSLILKLSQKNFAKISELFQSYWNNSNKYSIIAHKFFQKNCQQKFILFRILNHVVVFLSLCYIFVGFFVLLSCTGTRSIARAASRTHVSSTDIFYHFQVCCILEFGKIEAAWGMGVLTSTRSSDYGSTS